jgi:nitroreductase
MMDLLTAIENRASALKLSEPGPSHEHVERIVRAGARAPDHGRLRPWRFVVLEGDARQKLGDAMANALQAKLPQATPEQLDVERGKCRRAPTIIVAAARITAGKIPAIEQIIAVGAAVENMFLAANALGYGVMWRTGAAAYDANCKVALGLSADDHIVGLLYLGTTVTPGAQIPVAIADVIRWL